MRNLSELKGVGKTRLEALKNAGVETLRDLLFTLPISYKDTQTVVPLDKIEPGQAVCVCGYVSGVRLARFGGRSNVTATLRDEAGRVTLQYFNQPWMKENLTTDRELLLYGRVEEYTGKLVLNSPSIETERALQPVYRAIHGVPGKVMRALILQALDQIEDCVTETLPEAVRRAHQLCEINYALRQAHFPQGREALLAAKRRMAFEALLLYQAAMGLLRGARGQGVQMRISGADAYWDSLPYQPTGAQRRALNDIAGDLSTPFAMGRMVQGDVGCGKTAVAFGAIYLAARAGYQSALMAPTEILARQHLLSAQKVLEPLHISCGLLLGGMKAQERREALENIRSGVWQAVIGTHALIGEKVAFARLGLVITDEQHRFGVRQRRALSQKAEEEPNALVMSATPIPRSLALILYGDLDLSVIDEMPPGRTPVVTRVVPEEKREGLYAFLISEAKSGHQAYIVCPLVEEGEGTDAKSAQETYAFLSLGPLKSLRLGLTYGSQEQAEKERVIDAFSKGELDVLVSTTVIEVGVNVPNATVMVIENADRFGLSQLHQLRGRVGRGADKSWCFLLAKKNERLDALCRTGDGFEIAAEDLKQRGPGDLLGTRQHGELLLGAETDVRLIEETRECLKALRAPERAADLNAVNASAREMYQKILPQIALN